MTDETMTDADLWRVIDETRDDAGGSPPAHAVFLQEALEDRGTPAILAYDRLFRRLHAAANTWPVYGAAKVIGGRCSLEAFVLFRGWLISKGEAAYENALADPESLADVVEEGVDADGQFEGFVDGAKRAWEALTGGSAFPVEPVVDPPPSGEPIPEADLKPRYPRLTALLY